MGDVAGLGGEESARGGRTSGTSRISFFQRRSLTSRVTPVATEGEAEEMGGESVANRLENEEKSDF